MRLRGGLSLLLCLEGLGVVTAEMQGLRLIVLLTAGYPDASSLGRVWERLHQ